MLARSVKTVPIALGVLTFGLGGFAHLPAANVNDEVDQLALAQEEVDKYCAWTDLEKDTDYIPRSDRDESLSEGSLLCRDAKKAAWAILDERKRIQEAFEKAREQARWESANPEQRFELAMEDVFMACEFPTIDDPYFKNEYLHSIDLVGERSTGELNLECRKAKLKAIAIRDGKWEPPAATGYGKEYRPPVRPDFSRGPLDLDGSLRPVRLVTDKPDEEKIYTPFRPVVIPDNE